MTGDKCLATKLNQDYNQPLYRSVTNIIDSVNTQLFKHLYVSKNDLTSYLYTKKSDGMYVISRHNNMVDGAVDDNVVDHYKKISKLIFDRTNVINFGRMYVGFINNICHETQSTFIVHDKIFSINLITIISIVDSMYKHTLDDNELVYKVLYIINAKK